MKNLALVTIVSAYACSLCAADWPHWRGPSFDGSSPEIDLPVRWTQTDNIAWSADLPGPSAATPIVAANRVFLTAAQADNDLLLAICLDRADGKVVWRKEMGKGIRRDDRSNYAAPSAVTDGRTVVFFFSTGLLAAFDFDGNPLWSRDIQTEYGTFAFLWTFSSSPAIYEDKLYLQVLQRDVPVSGRGFSDQPNKSYILAVNLSDGKTIWRHFRPSDAVAESRESFASPVIGELDGRRQLLVVGGDALTGHDLASGDELWRWETWNRDRNPDWRLVPSPVAGAGVVLACAPKSAPVYAIRPAGKTGNLDDSALAWTSADNRQVTSDVPTPAFYDGDFFILSDLRKSLSRVDPMTGRIKWSIETPGKAKYEASPLAADGKLYIINHEGFAAVIDAKTGDILHTVSMDDPSGREVVRASVAASHGQLFIRTTRKIYCVGKGKNP